MSLPFQERGEDAPFPLPLFVRKGVPKKKKQEEKREEKGEEGLTDARVRRRRRRGGSSGRRRNTRTDIFFFFFFFFLLRGAETEQRGSFIFFICLCGFFGEDTHTVRGDKKRGGI